MFRLNSAMCCFRDLIHPIVLLLTKTRVKFRIRVTTAPRLFPNKKIIFAVNHTNSFDSPIAAKAISQSYGRRCVILAGKQNLWLSDKFFFFLNGTIWVDRKSKQEMSAIKDVLLDNLENRQAIMWFPEGTWNLTDNLLMLPLKWGIIDVAAHARAQIVPVVLDYDRKTMTCAVCFGEPIAPDEHTDKAKAIADLRDTMATLRWQQWEMRELLHRDEIDIKALEDDILIALDEYPPLNWEYEKSIIFEPHHSPKQVFSHLGKLIPCRENAFLFSKEYYNVGK